MGKGRIADTADLQYHTSRAWRQTNRSHPPPEVAFVTRLRRGLLPDQAAWQLPDLPTTICVGLSPTGDLRPLGRTEKSGLVYRGSSFRPFPSLKLLLSLYSCFPTSSGDEMGSWWRSMAFLLHPN
jgi:hypothetical protein